MQQTPELTTLELGLSRMADNTNIAQTLAQVPRCPSKVCTSSYRFRMQDN